MDVFCPVCANNINTGSINIDSDLVKCGSCGSVHESGDLISFSDEQLNNGKLILPSGSKINFRKTGNSSAEFILSPMGFIGKSISFLVFSTLWLIFLIIWSFIASRENLAYALFSLPFWLIAFWILTQTINSVREIQTVNLDKEFIIIKKLRPIRSKEFKIGVDEIVSIKLESYKLNGYYNNNRHSKNNDVSFNENHSLVPVISYGINKESFFENTSSAEQRWIVISLNGIISKLKTDGCF